MDELVRMWAGNIKRGREALGLKQWQLADLLGVRQASVCRWECAKAVPTDDHKLAIAAALHQDVRQLFPLIRVAA